MKFWASSPKHLYTKYFHYTDTSNSMIVTCFTCALPTTIHSYFHICNYIRQPPKTHRFLQDIETNFMEGQKTRSRYRKDPVSPASSYGESIDT